MMEMDASVGIDAVKLLLSEMGLPDGGVAEAWSGEDVEGRPMVLIRLRGKGMAFTLEQADCLAQAMEEGLNVMSEMGMPLNAFHTSRVADMILALRQTVSAIRKGTEHAA